MVFLCNHQRPATADGRLYNLSLNVSARHGVGPEFQPSQLPAHAVPVALATAVQRSENGQSHQVNSAIPAGINREEVYFPEDPQLLQG